MSTITATIAKQRELEPCECQEKLKKGALIECNVRQVPLLRRMTGVLENMCNFFIDSTLNLFAWSLGQRRCLLINLGLQYIPF